MPLDFARLRSIGAFGAPAQGQEPAQSPSQSAQSSQSVNVQQDRSDLAAEARFAALSEVMPEVAAQYDRSRKAALSPLELRRRLVKARRPANDPAAMAEVAAAEGRPIAQDWSIAEHARKSIDRAGLLERVRARMPEATEADLDALVEEAENRGASKGRKGVAETVADALGVDPAGQRPVLSQVAGVLGTGLKVAGMASGVAGLAGMAVPGRRNYEAALATYGDPERGLERIRADFFGDAAAEGTRTGRLGAKAAGLRTDFATPEEAHAWYRNELAADLNRQRNDAMRGSGPGSEVAGGAANQVVYSSRFAAAERIGRALSDPAKWAARRAAGGLRAVNPRSVLAYVASEMVGGTRDRMAPRFDIDASGKLVQKHAGNSAALAAAKAAGQEGLDFVTEQAAWDLVKGVGKGAARIVPQRARKWISKATGSLVPSGLRVVREALKRSMYGGFKGKTIPELEWVKPTKAGKVLADLSKAATTMRDLTGLGNLFEEIAVEEGMQAAYAAVLNLDNEYERAGFGNLGPAMRNLRDAAPEMALSMMLVRMGHVGAAFAGSRWSGRYAGPPGADGSAGGALAGNMRLAQAFADLAPDKLADMAAKAGIASITSQDWARIPESKRADVVFEAVAADLDKAVRRTRGDGSNWGKELSAVLERFGIGVAKPGDAERIEAERALRAAADEAGATDPQAAAAIRESLDAGDIDSAAEAAAAALSPEEEAADATAARDEAIAAQVEALPEPFRAAAARIWDEEGSDAAAAHLEALDPDAVAAAQDKQDSEAEVARRLNPEVNAALVEAAAAGQDPAQVEPQPVVDRTDPTDPTDPTDQAGLGQTSSTVPPSRSEREAEKASSPAAPDAMPAAGTGGTVVPPSPEPLSIVVPGPGKATLRATVSPDNTLTVLAPDGTVLSQEPLAGIDAATSPADRISVATSAARSVADRYTVSQSAVSSSKPSPLSQPAVTRSRPRERIVFAQPFVGPSGAALSSYEWQWMPEEYVDEKGEDRVRRVSDWAESEENAETGRMIVHQFVVRMPDGSEKTMSAESALQVLGYASKAQSGDLPSLVSAVRTKARQTMELARLEAQLEASQNVVDRVQAMPRPELVVTEGRTQDGEPKLTLSMGDAWVLHHPTRGRTDTETESARDAREKKEYSERLQSLDASWSSKREAELGVTYSLQPRIVRESIADMRRRIEKQDRKIEAILARQSRLVGTTPPTTTPATEQTASTPTPDAPAKPASKLAEARAAVAARREEERRAAALARQDRANDRRNARIEARRKAKAEGQIPRRPTGAAATAARTSVARYLETHDGVAPLLEKFYGSGVVRAPSKLDRRGKAGAFYDVWDQFTSGQQAVLSGMFKARRSPGEAMEAAQEADPANYGPEGVHQADAAGFGAMLRDYLAQIEAYRKWKDAGGMDESQAGDSEAEASVMDAVGRLSMALGFDPETVRVDRESGTLDGVPAQDWIEAAGREAEWRAYARAWTSADAGEYAAAYESASDAEAASYVDPTLLSVGDTFALRGVSYRVSEVDGDGVAVAIADSVPGDDGILHLAPTDVFFADTGTLRRAEAAPRDTLELTNEDRGRTQREPGVPGQDAESGAGTVDPAGAGQGDLRPEPGVAGVAGAAPQGSPDAAQSPESVAARQGGDAAASVPTSDDVRSAIQEVLRKREQLFDAQEAGASQEETTALENAFSDAARRAQDLSDRLRDARQAEERQRQGADTATASQASNDFELSARRMVEPGSQRAPNGMEWNVIGDRIEVSHSVTGRKYGHIDLKTQELVPADANRNSADRLAQVVSIIRRQSSRYAQESELDRLRQYPARNAAKIAALEKALESPTAPTLTKVRTVKVSESSRASGDQRFRVDQHVVEYRDADGNEFRKTFEVRRGETPNIPESGTHAELNAVKEQFREPAAIKADPGQSAIRNPQSAIPPAPAPSLSLESVTPDQLDAEARRKADRAKMEALATRPISGGPAIDTTFTLPGFESTGDLFSQPARVSPPQTTLDRKSERPIPKKRMDEAYERLGLTPPSTAYKRVPVASIDSPALGNLNAAREGKARAWKGVNELRERIKREPVGGRGPALRLELMRAENAHREWMDMERQALDAIEKRANELGQTTRQGGDPATDSPVRFQAAPESNPVTPEQDRAYLAAVEAGDMATAQRMVDEAAARAGYYGDYYHATHADSIHIFDRTKGYRNPKGLNIEALGTWFTDSAETARKLYGPNVNRYRLGVGGTVNLRRFSGVGGWNKLYSAVEAAGGVEKYRDSLARYGFTGIQIEGDFVDGELQTVTIALNPSQIKSADPVTRDDAGRVVPLSERFNPASPDIRFQEDGSSGTAPAITAASVRSELAEVLALVPGVEVLDSMDGLPPAILADVEAERRRQGVRRPRALFRGGKVYIFANEFPDMAEVRAAIPHEVAHAGLEGLPAATREAVWSAIRFAAARDGQVRRVLESVRKGYPGADPATERGRDILWQEVLARLAEQRKDLRVRPVWRKVVAAVRDWARQLGRALGIADYDPDVALVEQWVLRAVEQGAERMRGSNSMPATPVRQPSPARFLFGGIKSQAEPSKGRGWEKAADMLWEGKTPREVWQSTGWWTGPDGMWRFELDDSKMRLKTTEAATLGEAIDYPALFEAYPDAAGIELRAFAVDPDEPRQGMYVEASNAMFATAPTKAGLLAVVAHELQHAIQFREGFAKGGTPTSIGVDEPLRQASGDAAALRSLVGKPSEVPSDDELRNAIREFREKMGRAPHAHAARLAQTKTAEELIDMATEAEHPYRGYRRLAGEAEARMVQRRRGMSALQRRREYPGDTLRKMLEEEGLLQPGQNPEDALTVRFQASPVTHSLTSAESGAYLSREGVPDAKRDEAEAHVAAVLRPVQLDLFAAGGLPGAIAATDGPAPAQRPVPRKTAATESPVAVALKALEFTPLQRRRIEQRANAERQAWYANEWERAFAEVGEGRPVMAVVPELLQSQLPRGVPLDAMKIDGPHAVHAIAAAMRSPYFETFKVVWLDKRGRAIRMDIAGMGTLDACIVHPVAILRNRPSNAAGIIVSHNHPSGDPTPSAEDLRITKQLQGMVGVAGLKLYDHVVTNGRSYVSMKEGELLGGFDRLDAYTMRFPQPSEFGGVQAPPENIRSDAWDLRPPVKSPSLGNASDVAAALSPIVRSGDGIYLVGVDRKLKIVSVQKLPPETLARDAAKHSATHVPAAGGMLCFVHMQRSGGALSKTDADVRWAKEFVQRSSHAGVHCIDVVLGQVTGTPEYVSMRDRGLVNFVKDAPETYAATQEGAAPDIRFQAADPSPSFPVTPEQDRAYIAAVEAGDMATAQRMVDEAAKAAGFNVGPVFHGTDAQFDVFDPSKSERRGFYFARRKDFAESYAKGGASRLVVAYVSLKNPIDERTFNRMGIDNGLSKADAVSKSQELGHDGIAGPRVVVAFSPSQIKSADAVTRDDAGRVIPLSERFNQASPDIRFQAAKESGAAPTDGRPGAAPSDPLAADLAARLRVAQRNVRDANARVEKARATILDERRKASAARRELVKVAGTAARLSGEVVAPEAKAIERALRAIVAKAADTASKGLAVSGLRMFDATIIARHILDVAAAVHPENEIDPETAVRIPMRVAFLQQVVEAMDDLDARLAALPASATSADRAALHRDAFVRLAGRSTLARRYVELAKDYEFPFRLTDAFRKDAGKRLNRFWTKQWFRFFGGETVTGKISDAGRKVPPHPSKGIVTGKERLSAMVQDDIRQLLSDAKAGPDGIPPPPAGMDWRQKRDLVERAAAIAAQSDRDKEEIVQGHKVRREEMVEEAAAELSRHGPKPMDATLGNPRRAALVSWLNLQLRNWHGLAAWIAGGREGFLRDLLDGATTKAHRRFLQVKADWHREMLAQIEARGWRRIDLDRMSTDAREWTLKDGRKVRLTVSEVATLYGMLHNADATDKLAHNGAKSIRFRNNQEDPRARRIDPLDMGKLSYDEQAAARLAQYRHLAAQLPADVRGFVDWIVASNGAKASLANETSRRLSGVDKFTDPSFWTLINAVDRPAKVTDRDPEAGNQRLSGGLLERAGVSKERQMHRHTILLGDVFSVVSNHGDQLAAYIAMAEAEHDIMRLLSSGAFHDALVDRIGAEGVREMVANVRRMTGQEGFTDHYGAASKAFARLQGNMAVGILGFRPTSILANRIGGSASLLAMLWRDHGAKAAGRFLAKGVLMPLRPQWLSGKARASAAVLLGDGYLYERWVDTPFQTFSQVVASPDDPAKVRTGRGRKAALAWKGLKELAMKPMAWAEMRNAIDLYETLVEGGMPQAEAVAKVAQYTASTQNPSTPLEQNGWYVRSKASVVSSLFFPFFGQPTVMQNLVATAFTEAAALKRSGHPEKAARVAFASVVALVLSALWSAGARWFVRDARKSTLAKAGPDIDTRAAAAAFDALKEMADSTVGPAGSELIVMIEAAAGPKSPFRPVFRSPESMVGRIFQQAETLYKSTGKAIDGDDAAQYRVFKAAAELVSAATGAPLGGAFQVGETAAGVARQAMGEE